MPMYEYKCVDCKNEFSVTMSISEHDTKKVECPACKSPNVEWRPSAFFAVTPKKS